MVVDESPVHRSHARSGVVKPALTAVLLIIASSCAAIFNEDPVVDASATSIAILNVNVVPMDRERVIQSQTVLIDNGRITAIGPSESTNPPTGALRINGKGKYLLPGLIDMHVHIRSSELEAYLRGGVTSVRNMWGHTELLSIMQEIESKTRRGPRIFSLSSGFDASPNQSPEAQISDNPAAIRALIDRQYDLGYREIKVFQKLSLAAYDTIAAIAKLKGMTFAGHTPPQVGLTRVIQSGQRSIEHLGGYGGGSQLSAQVAATVQAGAYNCPTLAVITMLFSPATAAYARTITGALHAGGARLLVGTDSGVDLTLPGSSIHDELEAFVQSGISPFDALLGATRTAAEYLGQSAAIGTIEVGKEADLVLVRANPLQNIGATRDIDAVIVDGRLFN